LEQTSLLLRSSPNFERWQTKNTTLTPSSLPIPSHTLSFLCLLSLPSLNIRQPLFPWKLQSWVIHIFKFLYSMSIDPYGKWNIRTKILYLFLWKLLEMNELTFQTSWYQSQHSILAWMLPPSLVFVFQQKLTKNGRSGRSLSKEHCVLKMLAGGHIHNQWLKYIPALLASLASSSSKSEAITFPETSCPYKLWSTSLFPTIMTFMLRSLPSFSIMDLKVQ